MSEIIYRNLSEIKKLENNPLTIKKRGHGAAKNVY